jgi:mannose-6-phosphate isomerase-like protein (cupin superfamily)
MGTSRREEERMTGWVGNIDEATLANTSFRTVLFTGGQLQLTVMSLEPGEEIGVEMHDHRDQFLRVESGRATVTLGPAEDEVSETHHLEDDWVVIVPGGTWHNVINEGAEPLKLYSLYAPPEHPDGTVHKTKAEADAAEAEHH